MLFSPEVLQDIEREIRQRYPILMSGGPGVAVAVSTTRLPVGPLKSDTGYDTYGPTHTTTFHGVQGTSEIRMAWSPDLWLWCVSEACFICPTAIKDYPKHFKG